MRLKLSLKSNKKIFIPFNYNHILSSMIYSKITDLKLANKLHSSTSFKFFTFSQINIPQRKINKKGFITKGSISFQISSPNTKIIKNLINGYLESSEVNFNNQKLFIEIELLPKPKIENKINIKTISPIITRIKKEINGKLKIWDLSPGDQLFFKNLEKNLIRKYQTFHNKKIKDNPIKISSEMRSVKRKRINIKKGNTNTYHRAYMMDLKLEGTTKILQFAHDCGLGEKNSMGFGMTKIT